MDFFEAVTRRRSIRTYSDRLVPAEVINKAIDAALLAPNSSNMQTWKIYWVRDTAKKEKLVEICMGQGAARTLLVFTADPSLWKKNQQLIMDSIKDNPREDLKSYYGKLIPFLYGYRFLSLFKWVMLNTAGLFKPTPRAVATGRDIQEVAVKSTALACENFMLAIAAQGFDTCPMEGFDPVRLRKLLNLTRSSTVAMVISVGERTERGVWGERYRIPREQVVEEV
ncbi:MAG: nitroreductase family protein [Proteobacteria bacterium]|nr:MAG: nitroreductase family protein [Pseudomonadota bacterium]